jgi:hypothetical protein
MKFNKWTVGLAAVGVVSLASVARAEEKALTAMQTALSATTISGYVDTSAQWNLGTGNRVPNYRFGGPNKADGFNLDVVQLTIAKPLDESQWAAGYRADLWFGPDANVLGTSSTGSADDLAIRQAYVVLRAPVGNGLDFKMGVFDSIIGYESIESGNNPNYTRSYGHSIEPTTHTGLLATYRFCEAFSASAGVANTTDAIINGRNTKAESYKTYMGSIALTAPQDWGCLAGSTLYAGVVNGVASGSTESGASKPVDTSWYAGATVATPVTGLKFGGSYDYRNVCENNPDAYAIALYASYQATEKLSLHARGEYLRDETGVWAVGNAANPGEIWAATATVQYDLWQNVISRVEFRWDNSNTPMFGADNIIGSSGDRHNAYMLAANVIYKF